MPTIKASKRVNAGDLYDEIVAADPSLAPTPTGLGGRLEAKFVIEQHGDTGEVLVHLPDGTDEAAVDTAVKAHKRRPEKVVDPVADARKRVKQKADQGDPLAQDILTLLGS